MSTEESDLQHAGNTFSLEAGKYSIMIMSILPRSYPVTLIITIDQLTLLLSC